MDMNLEQYAPYAAMRQVYGLQYERKKEERGCIRVKADFSEITRSVTQTDGLGWGCVAPSALF